jgi:hypothetical protein
MNNDIAIRARIGSDYRNIVKRPFTGTENTIIYVEGRRPTKSERAAGDAETRRELSGHSDDGHMGCGVDHG